ncbi:MAG TPA: hypothetical protein VK663_14240 [Burkholderiales bacterium]|nr:hypothetical protein [Burkholderiales bacterium]
MTSVGEIGKDALHAIYGVCRLTAREKRRLFAEIHEVRGLLPLLMKPRNKLKWTRDDKALLSQHMKRLSLLSPYLAILVIPGGFLALPVLAWWLDRRRVRDLDITRG